MPTQLVKSRRPLFVFTLVVVSLLGLSKHNLHAQQASTPSPSGGAVAGTEPKFHIVRSLCGTQGSQKGDHFVMEDPRSVFYLPKDKQVMIYFEWDGPVGQHHFEGFWKNPEGKIVVFSDFSYEAKQTRFAGYWTLPLSDAISSGMWTLEAHVDGELAGTYSFQVTVAPRPDAPPARTVLSPADLYKLLLESTVWVQRYDDKHRLLSTGSGFVVGGGLIATTFENVESATSLTITMSDGATENIDGVVAWNRMQDWAVLRPRTPLPHGLVLAKTGSWQIGDSCYSLDSPQEGNRTIVSGAVTGNHQFADVGERWNVNLDVFPRSGGGPVVNEFGEVMGAISAESLVPGLSSIALGWDTDAPEYPINLSTYHLTPGTGSDLVVPAALIDFPKPETPVTTFATMESDGVFFAKLARNPNLIVCSLGKTLDRSNHTITVKDTRFEYQNQDQNVSVLATWNAVSRMKSMAMIKIYDVSNRLIGLGQPVKVNFSKGEVGYATWTFGIDRLPPGYYHVDLVLDTTAIWRTFFRMTN